jgi:hypothetical protein
MKYHIHTRMKSERWEDGRLLVELADETGAISSPSFLVSLGLLCFFFFSFAFLSFFMMQDEWPSDKLLTGGIGGWRNRLA